MKQSRKPRQGASAPAPRSNPAPPTSAAGPTPPPFQWSEPAAVPRWLDASRTALLDLLAVAREGARRPRKRVLSRAEMRPQARDAFAQATALLDLAAEALSGKAA